MHQAAELNRRRFCGAAAATVALAPLGFAERIRAMNAVAQQASGDKTAIRPFQVNVPEAQIAKLRGRIDATEWPDRETVTDESQGVQLATMQEIARYWATDYHWRKCEAKLNRLPNFLTEIDGLDIHFIHVRSKHENALPRIVTHGWPGSVIEQLKIIDPLTNPTAHGASASDAFHLVIPSLRGFGFSDKALHDGCCIRPLEREHGESDMQQAELRSSVVRSSRHSSRSAHEQYQFATTEASRVTSNWNSVAMGETL